MNRFSPHHISCDFCNARMNSVFNVLHDGDVTNLNLHKTCASFKKGQYVFTEHGLPAGLFCVNNGKIKLSATGPDGKEQILRLAKAGDVLGYRALIANERYHCSAMALEDSSICVIDKSYIEQLIGTNTKLAFEMLKKISGDLKLAEEHIVSLSQKNVRERMAEALLFLKATYGLADDGETLNVQLSREEIADYVGTSTESAIRQLSEFNTEGLVELAGKKIKLKNIARLLKTANIDN